MAYTQKRSMIAGTEPVKKAKEQKQPTYEGTDEYRKEKNIPLEEFKQRGINKNKGDGMPVKKSGLGPRTAFGGVKNPDLDPSREAEDKAE